MRFSPTYAIFLRYWYLLLGTPQRLVQLFIWSTFDILLWGFVTKYLSGLGAAGFNFTTVLLGSLVFWQLLTRMQQNFIMVFLEDSWTRNFLNVFASPISVVEYLAGIVASSLTTSVFAILIGSLVAAFVFGLTIPPLIVPFFLLAIILALFGIALGMVSSAIVLRFGPTAEWFAWPVPAILQPLVGVFYPISVLPVWAQTIALALPPTYVFENLRSTLTGGEVLWGHIGIALVLAVIYLLLAGWIFVRTYRWALRTGTISRFGSENS